MADHEALPGVGKGLARRAILSLLKNISLAKRFPQSRRGSRWPRTIRIRQDASLTTAEPTIAVARDQVIDRVADHPWDKVEVRSAASDFT